MNESQSILKHSARLRPVESQSTPDPDSPLGSTSTIASRQFCLPGGLPTLDIRRKQRNRIRRQYTELRGRLTSFSSSDNALYASRTACFVGKVGCFGAHSAPKMFLQCGQPVTRAMVEKPRNTPCSTARFIVLERFSIASRTPSRGRCCHRQYQRWRSDILSAGLCRRGTSLLTDN